MFIADYSLNRPHLFWSLGGIGRRFVIMIHSVDSLWQFLIICLNVHLGEFQVCI